MFSEGIQKIFIVDEGIYDPNTTKTGHHCPASEKAAFKWCFAGGPMMVLH